MTTVNVKLTVTRVETEEEQFYRELSNHMHERADKCRRIAHLSRRIAHDQALLARLILDVGVPTT